MPAAAAVAAPVLHAPHPARTPRTRSGQSRRNIQRHYDLSNDLFREFLDETMTYSSALFDRPGLERGTGPAWDQLADAQRRKIDRLLDLTQVGAGARVLEIGTGWGELAMRAAQRGATVHTRDHLAAAEALAEQRIAAAGLADRDRRPSSATTATFRARPTTTRWSASR